MSETLTKTAWHSITALPGRAVLPLIAALSALPVLVVAAFPSYLNIVVDKASYLVFHNVVEFFSIMVSLSIFGVGWFSYDQTKDRHALFLSCSFLAIGLIDFMHTLGNAAMPDLITPNSSNKSTQFWIAGRLFQGAVFLASAFIYAGSQKRWLTKTVLMTSTLLATGAVFAGVTFFPSYIPDTYVPGAGLTPFKKISEFLVIVLLSAAAIAYWRRMVKTGDRVALYYLAAFIIGIFSEISFAVYTKVFDTYNVLGHIYKVAAFFAIYKGIFIASVMEPYKRLRDVTVSRDEMEKEVRERIQTEKALMESEAKYRNLFNSMDEGFCIIEMIFDERARPVDYRFLEVNAAFEKQTGLQEVTGRSIRELAPANEAYWFEIYGNIALTGQPMRFINEAGALNRWYDVHAYRVGKPEDRHVAILFNDISRQKQIEEALSKAHDELELHVNERTGELKEAEARLRELNETLEQRVAERTAQLKAANASLVDSRRATLNMMEDALASSKNSEDLNIVLLKEIEERQRVEADLQLSLNRFELLTATAGELLQSTELQKVVESVCDKVMEHLECHVFFNFLIDEQAGKLRLNASAGVPEEEARRIEWLDFGVAVCGCAARDAQRIVAEHIPTSPDERTELVKSYGVKAYCCHPLIGPGGKVIGTLSFGTMSRETFSESDVALMKAVSDQVSTAMVRMRNERDVLKLSEDMAARNVELEEVNLELEAFIYSVSHDLRAPLRTMSSFAGFLGEDYSERLDDQARDYLSRIIRSSAKMSRLIEDLLDLSSLSRRELRRAETDITALASSIASALREDDPERTVEVLIEEGLTASSDPSLMESVFSNLLGNAWKFTSKTPNGRIEVGMIREISPIGLTRPVYFVKDNGPGFDPRYAEKMFQPFHRLHTENEFEGTGIGLAIVERIIRRHNGRVWAEGEVGKGATVYFTLG